VGKMTTNETKPNEEEFFVAPHLSSYLQKVAAQKWGTPPYSFEFRGLLKFKSHHWLKRGVMVGVNQDGTVSAVDIDLWKENPEWGDRGTLDYYVEVEWLIPLSNFDKEMLKLSKYLIRVGSTRMQDLKYKYHHDKIVCTLQVLEGWEPESFNFLESP